MYSYNHYNDAEVKWDPIKASWSPLSSFLHIFSRINATLIWIWWRSINNDTVAELFQDVPPQTCLQWLFFINVIILKGWKTKSPKHAEILQRCFSLSIHTCLQKLIEICRDATVLLMLTVVCPIDTHLSTFYFHGFMPWMSAHTCLMGSLLFFFFFFEFVPETVNNGQTVEQRPDSAQRISSSTRDYLILYDTLHHEGEGGTHIKKKNRGKETERNLLFCLVKAEVLFLDSLIKVSFAILSSRWEGTWAVRQTDSPLPHAHVHKRMHKPSPEHIIIRSTIWLTRGSSSIAQMLLPHKSVIKTSLRVAAPLVTRPALTFSIKYPPPRPTVAFSSPANWIQMYIFSLFPSFSLFPYIYIYIYKSI